MKKVITLLLLLFYSFWGFTQSNSPTVISSGGETNQGNTLQIDWTLGEVAITTIQSSSNQITQGFHQPSYTITTHTNELPNNIGQIKVFPNPTTDWIEMRLLFDKGQTVTTQLVDNNGKLIWMSQDSGTQIEHKKDLINLPNGIYFLQFQIDENRYSQTFKIHKL